MQGLVPGLPGRWEIDPSWSFARHLVAVFDFSSEAVPVNLVDGARPTVVGTGAFLRTSAGQRRCVGTQFGDSGGATYLTFPVASETVADATFVWLGNIPATGGTNIVLRDSTATGGTAPIWRGAGGGFDMRLGASDYTEQGVWDFGRDQCIVVQCGSLVGRLWQNGGSYFGGAPGASAFVSPWRLHKNGTNAPGCTAVTKLLAILDIVVPDALARSLSIKPWQIFRPAKSQVWSLPPAVASGVSEGAGAAAGSATVAGGGASVAAAGGASAGSAVDTGVGASIAAAGGASAGVAVDTGAGASIAAAAGASAGVATAAGVGAALSTSGAGVAAGVATVVGVGEAVQPFAAPSYGTPIFRAAGDRIRQRRRKKKHEDMMAARDEQDILDVIAVLRMVMDGT